ncbi:hypothetical protein [Haloplanus salilacus]|uniref:hypothetical protein n=1 Tax=Haloplanus salilacus TaxID=2949994 RepID=UPI0030D3E495
MTGEDDGATDSLTDRIRRTVTGPTDEERANSLGETAERSPEALGPDEVADLRELLGHEDGEVVGESLGAVEELATERPSVAAELAPDLVAVLTNRPADEWSSTTLREVDRAFMNDLLAGSALFELAKADPEHLVPVVGDLEERMLETDGRLEAHALFAFATVAASDVDADVAVPTEAFVDPAARTLRSNVDAESDGDDPFEDGLSITVATSETLVGLLEAFGGDRAVSALEYAAANTTDDDLSAAATDAIESIEAR